MGSGVLANVFFILGGISILMFGMRFMGSNLEQVAGNNMKKMLGKMTNNRFAGVGIGAAVTAIINSSAATTVMLVGFVNVGLMTLVQAASVIMGANIGTTITAQVLSLSGANGVDVAAIASVVSAVGAGLALFSKKESVKKTGSILLGLGMIFLGLKIMSVSAEVVINDATLKPTFEYIFKGDHFPLLLVLIGIVLTAVIQSSAAVTGILIAIGSALKFENAVFIILGSNIGTCVTAMISSIGTNTNAKRTAVIHLLFNLFGCLVCIAPLWIFAKGFTAFMQSFSGSSVERQIANFHTLFNVGTTIVLLPFTKLLVALAEKLVPESKNAKSEKLTLTFIDDRLLETPPIAAVNVKKEIFKMAGIAKENINIAMDMMLTGDLGKTELLKENEDALNFLNKSITSFLIKLMSRNITRADEKALGSYYHVVVDIERVGDYAENIMEYAEKLKKEERGFSPDAAAELLEVKTTINSLFDSSLDAFMNLDLSRLTEVDVLENSIDKASEELESKHIERVKKGECNPEVGSIYLQAVSNLERVGDHITNIAFSIKSYCNR